MNWEGLTRFLCQIYINISKPKKKEINASKMGSILFIYFYFIYHIFFSHVSIEENNDTKIRSLIIKIAKMKG